MRWHQLFSDLSAELESLHTAELADEIAERIRAESAAVMLTDRLRAAEGTAVEVWLRNGEAVRGSLISAAAQWALIAEFGAEVLVPIGAISAVTGSQVGRFAAPPSGPTASRLTLGHALRAVARDRSEVRLIADNRAVIGTLGRVGADHAELHVHPAGEPRRVSKVALLPFAAITAIYRTA